MIDSATGTGPQLPLLSRGQEIAVRMAALVFLRRYQYLEKNGDHVPANEAYQIYVDLKSLITHDPAWPIPPWIDAIRDREQPYLHTEIDPDRI
jgi:hypothetical protein